MADTDTTAVLKEGGTSHGDAGVSDSDGDKRTRDEAIPTTEGQEDSAHTDEQDMSTKDDDITEDEVTEVSVDPAVIEKLTTGMLGMFLPNLQKAKGSLNELLHNQEVLIETVQQENSKFTESASMDQLKETMQKAKVYHNKLLHLKKEMNSMMDKSTKLKRRAVKLQQQKQKEELTRAAQHERELERERMLTAKVAKPPRPDSKS